MARLGFFVHDFGLGYNNSGVYQEAVYTGEFLDTLFDDTLGFQDNSSCVFTAKSIQEVINTANTYSVTDLIIETAWVDIKSEEGQKLLDFRDSKGIKLYVRVHSQWSFMSQKEIAAIFSYLDAGIKIIFNEWETYRIYCDAVEYSYEKWNTKMIYYAGNVFPFIKEGFRFTPWNKLSVIKVGMFGELRPLKNHTMQVMALLAWSKELKRKKGIGVELHINTSFDNDPVLCSIRKICEESKGSLTLSGHFWLSGYSFDKLIKEMNLGLFVSFTESFNLTAARFVGNKVPVIGSKAIFWLPEKYKVDSHSPLQIKDALNLMLRENWNDRVFGIKKPIEKEESYLRNALFHSEKNWKEFLECERIWENPYEM
jgi:hypothetical protein